MLSVDPQSTVPSSPDQPLVVDLSESRSICTVYTHSPITWTFSPSWDTVNSDVVFWTSEVNVNESAAFQLSLTAPVNVGISSLPFSSLSIYFSNNDTPVIVRHSPSTLVDGVVQFVNLGNVSSEASHDAEFQASLRWQMGNCLVLSGKMSSAVPTSLKVGYDDCM